MYPLPFHEPLARETERDASKSKQPDYCFCGQLAIRLPFWRHHWQHGIAVALELGAQALHLPLLARSLLPPPPLHVPETTARDALVLCRNGQIVNTEPLAGPQRIASSDALDSI